MPNNQNSIKEIILDAISQVTGRSFSEGVTDGGTSIYELGIDSMGLVDLIFALEASLEIDIPLAELTESIFESLDSLTLFLNSRREAVVEICSLAETETAKQAVLS